MYKIENRPPNYGGQMVTNVLIFIYESVHTALFKIHYERGSLFCIFYCECRKISSRNYT